MDLWRISNHLTLNGEGGRRAPARWHSGGSPIVYLADSPPGALIEVLVHLEIKEATLPRTYTLLRIAVPDKLPIPALKVPKGNAWKGDEALTRKLGDAWLKSRRSVLARVPSAIIPNTFNYLLNPLHADASRIRIAESLHAVYDPRLLKRPAGTESD
ncbi:MAG TPA: RES family NAD+ phosphorylase [Acidobacteriaceae bacterium]|jgi:RES domain-containing protein